jgi:hypothetical protein
LAEGLSLLTIIASPAALTHFAWANASGTEKQSRQSTERRQDAVFMKPPLKNIW